MISIWDNLQLHTISQKELETIADFVGAVRVGIQYLDEALVDEDKIQELDEAVEGILNERKVFV